jgi:hypothetical protein
MILQPNLWTNYDFFPNEPANKKFYRILLLHLFQCGNNYYYEAMQKYFNLN